MRGSLPSPDVAADTIVLVEGASDRAAVEELARLRGLDLTASSVAVLAMGGATNIAAHLTHYGPTGRGSRLLGLVDAGEEHHFRTALDRAGIACGPTRTDLAAAGFGVCDADLEDELIRALGPAMVLDLVRARGHGRAFARLQQQPAHRHHPLDRQLHRFFGSGSGRKVSYPPLLVRALPADRIPAPLDRLLSDLVKKSG